MARGVTSPPDAPAAPATRFSDHDLTELGRGGAGPIVLATMGVEFDPRAADFAVDAAVESGLLLIVANVIVLEAMPMSLLLGYSNVLGDPPDLAASLRAPAVRAYALGVRVERVRIRTPHRVDALLEFVGERDAALLVFGPDRSKLSKRLHRKACKAIRDRAPCLVWTND
jgi:nucleotide-binding universal stress UspA family protein